MSGRKTFFDGKYLRLELRTDEIGVWYTSGEGQIRCLIIPRLISLEDSFFELLGVLDGEVCKKHVNGGGGASIKISNSEPVIINHTLKSFEKHFCLNRGDWTASLTLNAKDTHIDDSMDAGLKSFWSEMLGMDMGRIGKRQSTTDLDRASHLKESYRSVTPAVLCGPS